MNNLEKLIQQGSWHADHETKDVLQAMTGKVVQSIGINYHMDEMTFNFGDVKVVMYHEQDCCESVEIDDVCGDLQDLIGYELLVADERTSGDGDGAKPKVDPEYPEWGDESFTWSFYTFRTIKGTVDVRWYGSSNGYYSESVDAKVLRND